MLEYIDEELRKLEEELFYIMRDQESLYKRMRELYDKQVKLNALIGKGNV